MDVPVDVQTLVAARVETVAPELSLFPIHPVILLLLQQVLTSINQLLTASKFMCFRNLDQLFSRPKEILFLVS